MMYLYYTMKNKSGQLSLSTSASIRGSHLKKIFWAAYIISHNAKRNNFRRSFLSEKRLIMFYGKNFMVHTYCTT